MGVEAEQMGPSPQPPHRLHREWAFPQVEQPADVRKPAASNVGARLRQLSAIEEGRHRHDQVAAVGSVNSTDSRDVPPEGDFSPVEDLLEVGEKRDLRRVEGVLGRRSLSASTSAIACRPRGQSGFLHDYRIHASPTRYGCIRRSLLRLASWRRRLPSPIRKALRRNRELVFCQVTWRTPDT